MTNYDLIHEELWLWRTVKQDEYSFRYKFHIINQELEIQISHKKLGITSWQFVDFTVESQSIVKIHCIILFLIQHQTIYRWFSLKINCIPQNKYSRLRPSRISHGTVKFCPSWVNSELNLMNFESFAQKKVVILSELAG